jgi:hypothetical protein
MRIVWILFAGKETHGHRFYSLQVLKYGNRSDLILFQLPLTLSLAIDFLDQGSMPFGIRAHISTAVVGSKIYFFGGLISTDEVYYGSDEVYSYDTETDTWSRLENYSIPLYGICSATDGESIWTFVRQL